MIKLRTFVAESVDPSKAATQVDQQFLEFSQEVSLEAGRIIKAEGSTCQRNNNYVYTLSLLYDDGGNDLI